MFKAIYVIFIVLFQLQNIEPDVALPPVSSIDNQSRTSFDKNGTISALLLQWNIYSVLFITDSSSSSGYASQRDVAMRGSYLLCYSNYLIAHANCCLLCPCLDLTPVPRSSSPQEMDTDAPEPNF